MIIIFGIGNDIKNLLKTRHNAGFMLIDAINNKYKYNHNHNLLSLYKNIGYTINSAGEYLINITKLKDLWVAYDDLEVELGKIKWSWGISAKGHNGLKNIISKIGIDFGRIRIGISRPQNIDITDYVLSEEKSPLLYESIEFAAKICIEYHSLLKNQNLEALRKLSQCK